MMQYAILIHDLENVITRKINMHYNYTHVKLIIWLVTKNVTNNKIMTWS